MYEDCRRSVLALSHTRTSVDDPRRHGDEKDAHRRPNHLHGPRRDGHRKIQVEECTGGGGQGEDTDDMADDGVEQAEHGQRRDGAEEEGGAEEFGAEGGIPAVHWGGYAGRGNE